MSKEAKKVGYKLRNGTKQTLTRWDFRQLMMRLDRNKLRPEDTEVLFSILLDLSQIWSERTKGIK